MPLSPGAANAPTAVTGTHYCSAPSPGRPAALNPQFYHERQEQQLCLKHALNNCLGGEAFTDRELADGIRNEQIRQQRAEIDADPATVADKWSGLFKPGQLTDDYLRKHPSAAAELLADTIIENAMLDETQPTLVDYAQKSNQLELGLIGLRHKAGELGLPEAELRSFRGARQEGAMLDYLRETEARVDRMVLGDMTHFLCFRKNADGDWFMLNSNTPEQFRQSPSDYVRENPIGELSDAQQYQFLTFAGPEFVPNIAPHEKPPLGAGHLRV